MIRDVNYALRSSDDLWLIDVKVFLEVGPNSANSLSFDGYLTVAIPDVLDQPVRILVSVIDLRSQEFEKVILLNVSKSKVELWWPNGYGKQKLYTLTASWKSENHDITTNNVLNVPSMFSTSNKSVTLGFRTIEIIEDNLENGKTFYFKVNSIPIFMKGTNWIPSHILPEKSFEFERVEHLLTSVTDAHMNMIRVWGGGIYETDHFYDLADHLGILIWHDMMFACAMYPVFDEFLQ